MPKQEYKILEFHGGTNAKFDARDIADNQNASSQLSIANPGRLTGEGAALSLYDKTDINGKAINDITGTGGFKAGYGLFSFSHDYEMVSDIIQDGTDVDTDDSNWAAVNSDGSGTVAWNNAAPSVFDTSANEDASIYNTLGGSKLEANSKYILTFDVVTATLNLAIGGGDASGNTADETYVAAADYTVGTHGVTFTTSGSARTHLWFTADSSEISADGSINNISCIKLPEEVDTEFIVTNDGADIDIYDPNQATEWQEAKFTLGSRTATVKPEYYNVDGALRACDSHFAQTDVTIDTDAVINKNDVTVTTESGSIATGSIIQIEQEIMYVTSGSDSGTSITVIRGFANTKAKYHSTNQDIYYVNIPKYFGHIKQDRLFQCSTSVPVNTWVEDVQTPQPPNNTRKSDGTTGTLASSLGVQSLRIYDIMEGSTSNYPTEAEKVILEFGEAPFGTGITNVQVNGDTVTFTTSGYGNNDSASNKLNPGQEIILSNMHDNLEVYNGTHIVQGATATSFTITDNSGETLDGSGDVYYANASGWVDDDADDEFPDYVEVTVADSVIPFLDSSEGATYNAYGQTAYVHITGQVGVPAFNGVHRATRVADNKFRFKTSSHGSVGSVDGTTKIQQLIGLVSPADEGDAINDDIKRKWNFAMSFTYDGPAQEIQESLLTNGYKITPLLQADETTDNKLAEDLNNSETDVTIDDGSVLTDDVSVIMVGSEQMLVTNIADDDGDGAYTPSTLTVTRGYNGSQADTHSDNDSIYLVTELSSSATVDWTSFSGAPQCVIKSTYGHGTDEKTWNPRINGFKIYMKDVTEEDTSREWALFSKVNFNQGTYTIYAADDSSVILEQPATGTIATLTDGTTIKMKPIDTYLSENMFTEHTIIDAQYKCATVVGRRMYIGNIRQGGRTYPDRMLKSPVNKFDTFPETNYIDVAVGDGDSITALKSFGDRLLQFKKNKVYIINIGGEAEFLEAEYNNAGIEFPSQITKTNNGIAWINKAGLWFFDGKELENLTKFTYDGSFGIGSTNLTSPKIGYDSINDRVIFAPNISSSYVTVWYIYDLTLKAFQSAYLSQLFPFSANANYFTNMINDSNGDLVVGYVDGGSSSKTELNFYTWSNSDTGHQVYPNTSSLWLSKDIDFGSPGIRKKVYKVYITYKCSGHSGVKVEYSTDGGTSLSGFSTSASTNYSIGSLENTSGAWAVAELKPSSSINNIKSMQLSFLLNPVHTGTATGGSSTTIGLASHSASDGDYVNYNIYIYDGAGRYNSRKITAYDDTGGAIELMATWSGALTDRGYGTSPDTTSKYVVGSLDPDFEINDITIVYRAKPIK